MPCPALYSVKMGKWKKISSLKKCAIVLGTPNTVPFAGLDIKTFEFSLEVAKYLVERYNNINFSFIAHYIDELPVLTKIFGKNNVLYHYDSQKYKQIYREFDFVISTRVHGCGIASSLGIPNISIAHDARADTCEGFLSDTINSSYTLEEIDNIFKNYLDDDYIQNKNEELINFKKKTFTDYVNLIIKSILDKQLTRVKYSNDIKIPHDSLPIIETDFEKFDVTYEWLYYWHRFI